MHDYDMNGNEGTIKEAISVLKGFSKDSEQYHGAMYKLIKQQNDQIESLTAEVFELRKLMAQLLQVVPSQMTERQGEVGHNISHDFK